jgi:hypothetical protein
LCRRHFSADFITHMSEFDFRQAQLVRLSLRQGQVARKHGVRILECSAVDGIRLAGAMPWTPDDPRFVRSVVALAMVRADV